MNAQSSIVWFRQDLRLDDNPALAAAVARGGPVVPVFIWAPQEEGDWSYGAASRWWLHHSLKALDKSLRAFRSRLIYRKGESLAQLADLIRKTGANAVFWNRRYEPAAFARDAAIKQALRKQGITVESFNNSLLYEPWNIRTREDKPYQVFTPFWKACMSMPEPDAPVPEPTQIPSPRSWPESCLIGDFKLLPDVNWAEEIHRSWAPGEAGSRHAFNRFIGDVVRRYDTDRNRPAVHGSSRLSPYLHWGEISVRRIWHEISEIAEQSSNHDMAHHAKSYLRELGWREFAHHLLHHFPHTSDQPLREDFRRFPWRRDGKSLRAWQRGRTGYPIVDAGMRELWRTGWMHNRVRMIVASFLVKDLLLPWQQGAKWFWDTLVDASLANNTLGWQWAAGCGADAAPYFRIFNPVLQGSKFDPDGEYVRRWVPELSPLPAKWIHKPFDAPPSVLSDAGIALGKVYPRLVVDHAEARNRALAAFAEIRRARA